jgi:hypothetical protein
MEVTAREKSNETNGSGGRGRAHREGRGRRGNASRTGPGWATPRIQTHDTHDH